MPCSMPRRAHTCAPGPPESGNDLASPGGRRLPSPPARTPAPNPEIDTPPSARCERRRLGGAQASRGQMGVPHDRALLQPQRGRSDATQIIGTQGSCLLQGVICAADDQAGGHNGRGVSAVTVAVLARRSSLARSARVATQIRRYGQRSWVLSRCSDHRPARSFIDASGEQLMRLITGKPPAKACALPPARQSPCDT
jgi:hypothetical protein